MTGEQASVPPNLSDVYAAGRAEFRDAYPLTAEILQSSWQAFWDYHANQQNKYVVPNLMLDVNQLRDLRRGGRQPFYFPPECEDLVVLRESFPEQFAELDSNAIGRLEPARFRDLHSSSGWLATESVPAWSPNEQKEPPQGYLSQPLRLAPYIVASQAAKEFWGSYSHFDVNAAGLLPGTTYDSQHILVFHDQAGVAYIRTMASPAELPHWYGDYHNAQNFSEVPARTELILQPQSSDS